MDRRKFGKFLLGASAGAVFGSLAKSADAITLPYVYGAASSSLPRWAAARQRVLSAQGQARILCIGDSTTYGAGGPDLTGAKDLHSYCYPTQLAGMLSYLGVPTRANGFTFGPPGGQIRWLTDSRMSADPAWGFYTAAPTLGGFLARSTTPGAPLNFTPDNACDSWRVWHMQNVGQGSLNLTVGGASQTFNAGIAPAEYTHCDITAAGPTLQVSSAGTAPIYVGAIEAWNSQAPSVILTNAGWPGSKLGDWSGANSPASANNPLTAALAFAPDLYIIDAGINDWYHSTPLATFERQINAFLPALHGVADVLLVSGAPSNPGACSTCSVSDQQSFVTAMKNAASAHGIPFIDNWARFGLWAQHRELYTANPVSTDLHPNMVGYLRYAEVIAQVLAGV